MASKDNKAYTKVLIELDKKYKQNSLTGLYNNLINLMYTTEDETLATMIKTYADFLPKIEKYAKAKMSINTLNLINTSRPYKIALRDYCEQVIKTNKPEWQIIAERNGWRKT